MGYDLPPFLRRNMSIESNTMALRALLTLSCKELICQALPILHGHVYFDGDGDEGIHIVNSDDRISDISERCNELLGYGFFSHIYCFKKNPPSIDRFVNSLAGGDKNLSSAELNKKIAAVIEAIKQITAPSPKKS